MTKIENEKVESRGVKIAKLMIESKLQTQKEAIWAYENDPAVKEAIKKLKRRNEQRGTPIITKI